MLRQALTLATFGLLIALLHSALQAGLPAGAQILMGIVAPLALFGGLALAVVAAVRRGLAAAGVPTLAELRLAAALRGPAVPKPRRKHMH